MTRALAIAAALILGSFTAAFAQLSTDTKNDATLVHAINDPVVQARIWNLWNAQCLGVFSEADSAVGHTYRANMCLAIAQNKVPLSVLVSEILNLTTIPEVEITPPLSGSNGETAGGLVDADVNTAIGAALTVELNGSSTGTPVFTTATAASGAEAVTVASSTGIVFGQGVTCAGCGTDATVAAVNGTTVYLTQPTTAALSATPIAFALYTGLPVAWPTP